MLAKNIKSSDSWQERIGWKQGQGSQFQVSSSPASWKITPQITGELKTLFTHKESQRVKQQLKSPQEKCSIPWITWQEKLFIFKHLPKPHPISLAQTRKEFWMMMSVQDQVHQSNHFLVWVSRATAQPVIYYAGLNFLNWQGYTNKRNKICVTTHYI